MLFQPLMDVVQLGFCLVPEKTVDERNDKEKMFDGVILVPSNDV